MSDVGYSAQPQAPAAMLAQPVLALGGWGAYPEVQHSQYLADAIKAMSGVGSNIRTPAALGSNLLAEAILQFSQRQNNKALMNTIQQGAQSSMAGPYQAVFGDAGSAQPAPASGGGGGAPSAPAAPPPAPPPSAADMAAGPQNGAGPNDLVAAIQRVTGGQPLPTNSQSVLPPQVVQSLIQETGGRPRGVDAVATVLANRMRQGNETLPQVIGDRNQFGPGSVPSSGENKAFQGIAADPRYQPGAPDYERVAAEAGPYITGAKAPVGDFTGFYSPSAGQAFGENRPSWDDGTGQHAGGDGNLFFSHPYGGFTHPGQPGPSQLAGAAPQAQPYQIASNGPTPLPPQSAPPLNSLGVPAATPQTFGQPFAPPPGPGGPPQPQAGPVNASTPPPMGQPMTQQQQQPPQPSMLQQAMAAQRATPEEKARIQQELSAPPGSALWAQGKQDLMTVYERQTTRPAPPKDTYWGPNGSPVSELPYTDVRGGASFTAQRGPDNKLYYLPNPDVAPPQAGQALTGGNGGPVTAQGIPGGQIRPLLTPQERAQAGISPNDHAGYGLGPDGHIVAGAPAAVPPTLLASKQQDFLNSQEMQEYSKVRQSAQGLMNAYAAARGTTNGILGVTAMDTLLQSYGVNRLSPSASEDLAKATGFSDQVATKMLQAFNHGGLGPDDMHNILSIVGSEVQSRQQAAQQRLQADSAFVHGLDPQFSNVPGEIVPPAPSMPTFGQGQRPTIDPRAAAAELMRRGYHFTNGQWSK